MILGTNSRIYLIKEEEKSREIYSLEYFWPSFSHINRAPEAKVAKLKGLLYVLKLNLIHITFMPLGWTANVLSPKAGSRERKESDGKCPTKKLDMLKGGKTT